MGDPAPARLECQYDWIPELTRERQQRQFKGVRKYELKLWLDSVLDDLETARAERDALAEQLRIRDSGAET